MAALPHGSAGKPCVICLDELRTIRLACGHCLMCRTCFEDLPNERCPSCRWPFAGLSNQAILEEGPRLAREDTFVRPPQPPPQPPPPPPPQPPQPPQPPTLMPQQLTAFLAPLLGAGYEYDQLLGRGGFGSVHVLRRAHEGPDDPPSPPRVVVKEQRDLASHHREAAALARLGEAPQCEHIIGFYGQAELVGPGGQTFGVLALELATAGDIFDWLLDHGPVRGAPLDALTRQIVAAFLHCHSRGVAHLDVKLENLVIVEAAEGGAVPHIKLIDFGLARCAMPHPPANGGFHPLDETIQGRIGSRSYAAPETFGHGPFVPWAADVWSLGVCCFALAHGFFPLDIANATDWRYLRLQTAQIEGQSTIPTILGFYNRPTLLGAEQSALIEQMLKINPAERPTAAALHALLMAGDVQPNLPPVPVPVPVPPPHPLPLPAPPAAVPDDEALANLHELQEEETALVNDDENGNAPIYRSSAADDENDNAPVYRSSAAASSSHGPPVVQHIPGTYKRDGDGELLSVAKVSRLSALPRAGGACQAACTMPKLALPYLSRQHNLLCDQY